MAVWYQLWKVSEDTADYLDLRCFDTQEEAIGYLARSDSGDGPYQVDRLSQTEAQEVLGDQLFGGLLSELTEGFGITTQGITQLVEGNETDDTFITVETVVVVYKQGSMVVSI